MINNLNLQFISARGGVLMFASLLFTLIVFCNVPMIRP